MMPWLDRHHRFRDQLSPYLDDELAPARREALERHLASCDACRRELADLSAAVRALRELPSVDVPRSFTLTPEQARTAAPRAVAPRLPSAAPLMAGALAFALAVVLVVDLGDFGGGAPPSMRQEAPVAEQQADADREPVEAPGAGITTGAAGGPATGGTVPQQTPEALAPAPTPAPSESIPEGGDVTRRQTTPPQPEAEPAAAEQAGDGGLDPLRAAELGLAAALAALVLGGAGYAAWTRRRT